MMIGDIMKDSEDYKGYQHLVLWFKYSIEYYQFRIDFKLMMKDL